ncbi:TetR/AcrR family transcriptional regulator [Nocardia testacea]|uniref:TetR/AcrR family transcriptional regulator n=1 Tax=Nocardia testacea TaxID=248551 RepID=UPI0033D9BF18
MSVSHHTTAARRRLTGKRAATVGRLTEAAMQAVREIPYSELTFQQIAARAGVTRATAYVYFSSKEHLIAEIYRRRLLDTPPPDISGLSAPARVAATLRHLALLCTDNPEFGRAAARSLLSDAPDVEELRIQINTDIRAMLTHALGPDADTSVADLLELVYAGAIMRAGTGHQSYLEVAATLEHAAHTILATA